MIRKDGPSRFPLDFLASTFLVVEPVFERDDFIVDFVDFPRDMSRKEQKRHHNKGNFMTSFQIVDFYNKCFRDRLELAQPQINPVL